MNTKLHIDKSSGRLIFTLGERHPLRLPTGDELKKLAIQRYCIRRSAKISADEKLRANKVKFK